MIFFLLLFSESIILKPELSTLKKALKNSKYSPTFLLFSGKESLEIEKIIKTWNIIEKKYDRNNSINTVHVSCLKNYLICKSFNVKVSPFIRVYFSKKHYFDYFGPWERKKIKFWINSMIFKHPITINSFFDLNSYVSNSSVTFLLTNSELYQEYSRISQKYHNISASFLFLNSTNFSNNTNELVTYISPNIQIAFNKEQDLSIQNFIWKHQFPLVFELTQRNYPTVISLNQLLSILFIDPSSKSFEKDLENYQKQAEKYYNKMIFSWMNGITYGELMNFLKIQELPSIAILNDERESHVIFPFSKIDTCFNETIQNQSLLIFSSKRIKFFLILKNYVKNHYLLVLNFVIIILALVFLISILVKTIFQQIEIDKKLEDVLHFKSD